MDEITGFKMENGEFIQINKSHFKKILGKEPKISINKYCKLLLLIQVRILKT